MSISDKRDNLRKQYEPRFCDVHVWGIQNNATTFGRFPFMPNSKYMKTTFVLFPYVTGLDNLRRSRKPRWGEFRMLPRANVPKRRKPHLVDSHMRPVGPTSENNDNNGMLSLNPR